MRARASEPERARTGGGEGEGYLRGEKEEEGRGIWKLRRDWAER